MRYEIGTEDDNRNRIQVCASVLHKDMADRLTTVDRRTVEGRALRDALEHAARLDRLARELDGWRNAPLRS